MGNYYCDYCKIFVRNDAFNRRQHEASPRHQGALKRQVRDIHRNAERQARDLAYTNRELARMGGKLAETKPKVETAPKKINIGVRPQKKERTETLDDSEVYRAALAAQARPGEWSAVAVPAEEGEGIDQTLIPPNEDIQDHDELKLNLEDDTIQADSTIPSSSLKRRRDGADEELIKFKVETKKLALPVEDAALDASPIVFKKKKKKETIKKEE